jgi:hypothetical protein
MRRLPASLFAGSTNVGSVRVSDPSCRSEHYHRQLQLCTLPTSLACGNTHILGKPKTLSEQEMRQRATKYCRWEKKCLHYGQYMLPYVLPLPTPLIPLPFTSNGPQKHRFAPTTAHVLKHTDGSFTQWWIKTTGETYLPFLLHPDVLTRQCHVNKDPHTLESYGFTIRYLLTNKKTTEETINDKTKDCSFVSLDFWLVLEEQTSGFFEPWLSKSHLCVRLSAQRYTENSYQTEKVRVPVLGNDSNKSKWYSDDSNSRSIKCLLHSLPAFL